MCINLSFYFGLVSQIVFPLCSAKFWIFVKKLGKSHRLSILSQDKLKIRKKIDAKLINVKNKNKRRTKQNQKNPDYF